MYKPPAVGGEAVSALRQAALDSSAVAGLTHRFYRYPARFSPTFARAAITQFSRPGELVLDPYMGGGTTIVEALASGRRVVGCDINSLSVFVTRAKTTRLTKVEMTALRIWADTIVPELWYADCPADLDSFICERRTHNLSIPRARALKKVSALAIRSLERLPSDAAKTFARCALLNVGQFFLNGRKPRASVSEFRERLQKAVHTMLAGLDEFTQGAARADSTLINASATELEAHEPFASGALADLVVTSPPYPGIHMLYHRWQVDGRKESPAPYWLADCQDGRGNAYYNFADRRDAAEDAYFQRSLETLSAIRGVTKDGGIMVQLIAFSDPARQLRRYLRNMNEAGFEEMKSVQRRIWRDVPSRKWHATLKGDTPGSREVVLIHRAARQT